MLLLSVCLSMALVTLIINPLYKGTIRFSVVLQPQTFHSEPMLVTPRLQLLLDDLQPLPYPVYIAGVRSTQGRDAVSALRC